MTEEPDESRLSTRELIGDVVRGFFVAGLALLALNTVGYAITGSKAVYGFAAIASVVGLAMGVRLWLRSSWHVITVMIVIWLLVLPPIIAVEVTSCCY